jgi:hypothetical protein
LLAGIGMASAQHMPGGSASPSPGGSPGGAATPSQSQSAPIPREQGKPGQAQSQREQGKKAGPKSETTGQAPQGKEQPRAQGKEERHDQTTGQSKQPSTQTQPGGAPAPTTGQAPRQPGQPGQAPQGQAQQGQTGGAQSGGVTLSTEQRTKIRQTVLVGSAPRVSSVNFSLSVGTVVPSSVRVVAIHPTLVEIHPEWRGFFYFVVGDEIIIVDGNHHIVAVIAV